MSVLSKSKYDRRKSKVVDFFIQMQIAAEVLLLSVVLYLLILFMLYVPPFATLFSGHSLETHQYSVGWLIELNAGKWPLFVAVVVGWVYLTIMFSHRIIGPYYRMLVRMRGFSERDFRALTFFRKFDYFRSLAPLFNQVVQNTEHDVDKMRKSIDRLHGLVEGIEDGERKRTITATLESMEDQLSDYQLAADRREDSLNSKSGADETEKIDRTNDDLSKN